MKIRAVILAFSFITFLVLRSEAQCTVGVTSGVNLVTNGDFSSGYTGWTYDANYYTAFTACGSACYSVPGKIYVGTTPTAFNSAFTEPTSDHTSTSDNMFLMVDGVCTANIDLWKQTNIPVISGTTYYFSVWVTSLDAASESSPGQLQFVINGSPQATTIKANQVPGTWQQYTASWVATLTGNITIEIQNTTTTGCTNAVDFAVDDISFTPGCIGGSGGSIGPVPNLGSDFSICGKTTPFNINPSFNAATQASSNVTYTWYKNGTQVSSGTGSGFYNYAVSAAGTYQVCVDSGPACVKSDILIISNTYSINLGGPYTLCSPATQTLNAGYTGPGVTYQWYMNGTVSADKISGATSSTYTVSAPGTYYVIVNDPVCGQQQGSAVVTSNLPTPLGGYFCPTSGTGTASVSGTGDYYWFSSATGGAALNATPSTSYNATGLTGAGPYTFYVQDSTPTAATVGPSEVNTVNNFQNPYGINAGASNGLLVFDALAPVTINSITVLVNNYYCGPTTMNSVTIQIANSSGVNVTGSPITYSALCTGMGNGASAIPMTVPLNITIPTGTGYQMSLAAGSGNTIEGYLNTTNGGSKPSPELYTYPTTYSGAVTFVTNSAKDFNLYYSPDAFPGYFNWSITKYPPCGRTPVVLTANCAAPVKFADFRANIIGNAVLLTWQTANEQNSSYFSVERSTDGINFNSIGTVKAADNSNSMLAYSYTDKKPSNGNNYYRIIEYDKDGGTTVSVIRAADFAGSDLLVMPNPNTGTFTVSGKVTPNSSVRINVQNSLGIGVYENVIYIADDNFSQVITINNLPSGIYYLEIQDADNTWVKKIVKE